MNVISVCDEPLRGSEAIQGIVHRHMGQQTKHIRITVSQLQSVVMKITALAM